MHRNKKLRVKYIINDYGETAGPSEIPQESKNICFPVREVNITDLPNEVLAVVFSFLSYRQVAHQLRPVCRHFCNVATLVLNCEVATLGLKIDRALLYTEERTDLDQDDQKWQRKLCCCKALEIMKYQFLLIRAVTWRYISNPFMIVPLACFYAGQLLDDFLELLKLSRQSPTMFVMLYHHRISESSVIRKLVYHCTKFMNHFERVTEKKINVHYSLSGCKIVDLLDCLDESDIWVPRYKYAVRTSDEGDCHIKAQYKMQHTWFTCVKTQEDREYTWKDEQRVMYTVLRRLIMLYNYHEREQLYHECHTWVHGYGFGGSRRLSSDDQKSPSLNLYIYIDIQCPLELAPIDYLDNYNKPDLDSRYNCMIRSRGDSERAFKLKMNVYNPPSFENRLPLTFTWDISSDNFGKINLCDFISDDYCSVPVDVSDTESKMTAGSVVHEP